MLSRCAPLGRHRSRASLAHEMPIRDGFDSCHLSLDIADVGVVEPIHAVEKGAPVALVRIIEAGHQVPALASATPEGRKELVGHNRYRVAACRRPARLP